MRELFAATQNANEINRERQQMHEGLVVSGSWDAPNNTVQVLVGDTVGYENPNFADGQNQPLILTCTLCSPLYDQAGPVGGERAQCWEAQGGWFCWLELGPDDSPGAPSGERWIMHRSAADLSAVVYDSYHKLTNDGPTPGDAKGGVLSHGGALHKSTTGGGHSSTMDDTAKQITVKSSGGHTVTWDDEAKTLTIVSAGGHKVTFDDVAATVTALTAGGHLFKLDDVNQIISLVSEGGHVLHLDDKIKQVLVKSAGGLEHLLDDANQKIQHIAGSITTTLDKTASKLTHAIGSVQTIVDGAGNAISHVATTIGLGDLPGNLPASAAAITNDHLTQFESDLFSKRLDDLTKFAAAMVAAGVPNAGSVISQLASLLHIQVPSGSSITFIK